MATTQRPSIEDIVEKLLTAPKIVREVAAMTWQVLNAPPDGTMLLVWQPQALGSHFATDGYVWAGQEHYSSQPVGSYVSLAK